MIRTQNSKLSLLTLILALLNTAAFAQNSKFVTLTPDESTSFVKAATSLATQARICLVFEDSPFEERFVLDEKNNLTQTLPVMEAVRRFASAYDYELVPAEQGKIYPNVISLRKRFTDYRDLPYIPFEELQFTHQQMARFVSSQTIGQPVKTLTNAALDIADTFGKDMLATMSEGGITSASLTPSQREQILRLTTHLYLDGFDTFFRISANFLDQIKKRGKIQKEQRQDYPAYSEWNGMLVLGIALPEGAYSPDATGMADFTPCYSVHNAPPLTTGMKDRGKRKEQLAVVAQTLQETLARLNQGQSGYSLSAEPVFARKRLSLFGEQYADPLVITRAIASLYGLGIRAPERNTVRIVRRSFPPVQSVAEFRERMIQLAPDPLVRYLRFHEIEGWKLSPMQITLISGDPNWEKRPPSEKYQAETFRRSWQAGSEALSRMEPSFQRAEKEMTKRSQEKNASAVLPFDALPVETQDMFALYWFNRFITAKLQEFPVEVPDHIVRFDTARIQAGWKWSEADKDNVFFCKIRTKRSDGFETGTGITTNRSTRFPER